MKMLTYTTLFPNRVVPHHGIFVEQRLRKLTATRQVEAKVVAPVPWFPSRHPIFGRYGNFAKVPKEERRYGIDICHPRYPVIPKFGMSLAPALMVPGSYRSIRRHKILRDFQFEIIDAHYFYPDAVSAAMLSSRFGIPLIITARGTDINLIPKYNLPRRQILWAAGKASAIITVCEALKTKLCELGVPTEKITVLRNGVDLEQFRPVDQGMAIQKSGFTGKTLLSVGHLVERKGHHIVIQALRDLPEYSLAIIGDGPEKESLERFSVRMGVEDRVTFLGALGQAELPDYYAAADALVLASSREGMANVLLEALACGTPVVATDVWGAREVISEAVAGVLVPEGSPLGVAEGVRRLENDSPGREEVRGFAQQFSWDATTQGQLDIMTKLCSASN